MALLLLKQQADVERYVQAGLQYRDCDFPHARVFETISEAEAACTVQ